MKISIDTESDSKDEIRKMIRFLQQIVGESTYVSSESSKPSEDFTINADSDIFGALNNDSHNGNKNTDMFGNEITPEEEREKKKSMFNIEIVDDF